jgi:Tol biopolymer transport system component
LFRSQRSGWLNYWIVPLDGGTPRQLNAEAAEQSDGGWSPDGKWIAYVSRRVDKFGIYRKRTDGSGTEDVLAIVDRPILTTQWTHDGKYLLYNQRSADSSHGEIWSLPLEGDRKPTLVQSHGTSGQISPDGRWLAFSSNESGIAEVYVVAYGGGQGKWQVSANGGTIPQWSPDGKQLYYLDSVSSVLSVPVKESGGALQFGAQQTLVDRWTIVGLQFYDVSPDGKKILLDRVAQQVSPSVTVVTNFVAELNK